MAVAYFNSILRCGNSATERALTLSRTNEHVNLLCFEGRTTLKCMSAKLVLQALRALYLAH